MSDPSRRYTSAAGNPSTAFESTNRGLFDFGMVVVGEDDAWGWCPICFNKMDMNGATNEHILTAAEHTKIFGSTMDEAQYNADWNMMQAHARCNSSKGTRGIFETWRGGRPTGLSDKQYQGLCTILDFFKERGKESIGQFAKGEYKSKLQYIMAVVTGRSKDTIEHFVRTD